MDNYLILLQSNLLWILHHVINCKSLIRVSTPVSPSHSHWLPQDGFHRPSPSGSLFTPCPCSAPSSSSAPSDRTIPLTRPSPRTQALATSGSPCKPASDHRSPPTSSMASRNPTPIASPSGRCTRTLSPLPSLLTPRTGCWESARLRPLPLSGVSPGPTVLLFPNSAPVSLRP